MHRPLTTGPNRPVFSCAWEGFQIALIVWVICVVCTVVPAAFEPHRAQLRPEPPRIAKNHSRITPAALRFTAGLPWSCETIRRHASGLTKEQMDSLARAYGLTPEQKAEAMKCLKKELKT